MAKYRVVIGCSYPDPKPSAKRLEEIAKRRETNPAIRAELHLEVGQVVSERDVPSDVLAKLVDVGALEPWADPASVPAPEAAPAPSPES